MVLSPMLWTRRSTDRSSFSILYRIDGFVTAKKVGRSAAERAFQHPLPDRWFCHIDDPNTLAPAIATFSILYRIDGFVTGASQGSAPGECCFQHPLPDRWFCHPAQGHAAACSGTFQHPL